MRPNAATRVAFAARQAPGGKPELKHQQSGGKYLVLLPPQRLGDMIAVTDGNVNISQEYGYDPYGNIITVRDGSGSAVNVQSRCGV
jgi:hypothetical protein